MNAVSRPDTCQHPAEVTFPTDRSSLWQGAKDYPAVEEENDNGDKGRTPAVLPKSGSDEIRHNTVDERTGSDMDNRLSACRITSNQPSAEPAQYPDDRKGNAGAILAIPEKEDQQDEKRQGIGQQVLEIGVKQRAEDYPNQP